MRGISRVRRRMSRSCARRFEGVNGTLGENIESCLLKRAMRQAGEDPKLRKHSGECPNAITAWSIVGTGWRSSHVLTNMLITGRPCA